MMTIHFRHPSEGERNWWLTVPLHRYCVSNLSSLSVSSSTAAMGIAIVLLMIRVGVLVMVLALRGEETKAITTPCPCLGLVVSVMMDRAVTNKILQYIIIITVVSFYSEY
mmetsp:Transcript_26024/g.29601  ORF Transcript_26024/g.29601 Transcript_26024/m.29601 type:complete len:110 (+) Transcript_26024:213-542(+)